jgi:putative hydrolase of HD superfamily
MKFIGKNIRQARKNAALSQKDLAKKLKLSHKSISAYETGRAIPPADTLVKISLITNTPIHKLVNKPDSTKKRVELPKEKNILDLFLQIGVLKQVERIGWVLKGIKNPESIADHNFRVTIMAMILCDYFPKINKERVLELSLIHDWGVIKLGDIISEHGKSIVANKNNKKEEERNVVKEILKSFNQQERYLRLWDEYYQQRTAEATFLKQIEKLEMAIQALEYESSRETYADLGEFWNNAEKYLKDKELEPIFKKLKQMSSSG